MPVLAGSAALAAYNNLLGGFIPSPWYVPAHLVAVAVIVAAARRLGLGGAELGATGWAVGVRWGLAVALVVVAGIGLAALVPALRPLLEDERVAGASGWIIAYRALVRIPLGTVLLEEVAFRGALLAAWTRWQGRVAAVVGSSLVFGLWHVRPTLELLDTNDLAGSLPARLAAVAGAVALTTLAGAFFAVLRLRAGSLAAPMVAHAGINSAALVAAWLVL